MTEITPGGQAYADRMQAELDDVLHRIFTEPGFDLFDWVEGLADPTTMLVLAVGGYSQERMMLLRAMVTE